MKNIITDKNNWQTKKLGELCDITTGNSNTVDAVSDGQYAFFDRSKIIKRSHNFLFDSEALIIPGEGAEFFPRYYSGKFNLHQRAYALLNFNKNTNVKFVEYFLIFEHKYFERVAVGATAKSLRRRHFEDLEIPLPPLPEQHRIVKILDEVFENITEAKENAEKNLQNSKDLFESYLQNVFAKKGNGWEEKTLGEVCRYDKTPYKKSNLPYVGLEDIESNSGKFLGSLDSKKVKSNTFHFTPEHVLYGRLRPYLNKVLLPDFEGHCSTEIFPIKPSKDLYRGFLFFWLISKKIVKKINATWTGARMPRANMNEVLDFIIPIPSISEQKSIVAKLDALSEQTKKLEEIYKQKLADLEELKKSVLKKAFSGEL
ncbi:MAG TPA: restriction endonuclease subunit S [Candidatus Magasanikbacteria bacterium]|nr:restriction endonuclease subunit S [Candidatus Magasanikbacteria bacterium]